MMGTETSQEKALTSVKPFFSNQKYIGLGADKKKQKLKKYKKYNPPKSLKQLWCLRKKVKKVRKWERLRKNMEEKSSGG